MPQVFKTMTNKPLSPTIENYNQEQLSANRNVRSMSPKRTASPIIHKFDRVPRDKIEIEFDIGSKPIEQGNNLSNKKENDAFEPFPRKTVLFEKRERSSSGEKYHLAA